MLHIKNLSVEYAGGQRALDTVSFALAPTESLALIGANGAGKTSLLLALVGIVPLKAGDVYLDGLPLGKKTLADFRARLGLLFQNPDEQLFMPNVFEDVAFGPRSFGYDEEKTRACAENALAQLHISHLRERSPLRMSGGEKRLAAIATVLALQPQYLLFDEPTAFLDPRARRNLQTVINGLPQGKVIATHDLAFAAATCSRVLILQEGRVAAAGGIACLQDSGLLESAGL
jgi:cobalt/nickel transport system ATP-binding protein